MIKSSSVALLALASVLAHAQPSGDASSNRSPILNSKPQLRAEQEKDARPSGKVKAIGGDELKSPEDDSIGSDKSAAAGQQRVTTREARHPDRRPPAQAGTPDLPGAK
ncbi:cell envelope biogenesis protein TolA [Variovorax sp. J22P168]|uniref:cell envelope biogenesis protein TolA n=1 Tax=Variovorax jilinensis TaxID=3053513 RepID=UPI002575D6E6|nr:cell envelope biogenesis protein TolA [Variovorax sp. J22P168]MDM0015219.1 cell envelope biogenesis protein TolA [Variovorax sp. J22P168]